MEIGSYFFAVMYEKYYFFIFCHVDQVMVLGFGYKSEWDKGSRIFVR